MSRGLTRRFLCRIKEEEILEPLVPSILANLEHRHSYVRRNAVLAINSIYKLPKVGGGGQSEYARRRLLKEDLMWAATGRWLWRPPPGN